MPIFLPSGCARIFTRKICLFVEVIFPFLVMNLPSTPANSKLVCLSGG